MNYQLYSADRPRYGSGREEDPAPMKISCVPITPKLKGWKNALQWNIATLGKVNAYVVYDGSMLIHFSYVVRGREKFRFLNKGDIEIGPCWTHPDHRGKGIYPMVLSHIIQKELGEGGTAYMIIADTNGPSQCGVAKAGFQKTGDVVERDVLKRYRVRMHPPRPSADVPDRGRNNE